MTALLTFLGLLLLFILIILGALYISTYELAPFQERVRIFGVGFGMYIGILLVCIGF